MQARARAGVIVKFRVSTSVRPVNMVAFVHLFSACALAALPERHLATGSFSGRLQTWDLDRAEQPVYDAVAHKGIVNGIDGFGGQVLACVPQAARTRSQPVL